ncbi:MAG: DUF5320 domain-containing protein [Gammaproteobacteria bacterium]|nr:DUF5320 domain-containing protein [Gammaproteobacteria bacterium]
MDKEQAEKETLVNKRNELRQKLEDIEKDYRRGLDPDSGERAVQLENAEVLEGIAKAVAEELERIEEQLAELP